MQQKVPGIGEQNLPPQNVSLAWVLFQAENNQGPKYLGKNFDFPPNFLKNLDREFVPGRELSP